MPALLPAGIASLPPLGGRLLAAYRLAWWMMLALAAVAVTQSLNEPSSGAAILGLRLLKSLVLLTVSAILFQRRTRDPVAAMLALAFLLWIASSSIDFSAGDVLQAILDRFRFLLFASALLLFPDGSWKPRWTPAVAVAIAGVFLLGICEATGLAATNHYLPLAIGCVLLALAALVARYRELDEGTQKQQLKWVTLGLFAGISLILTARFAALLTAGRAMPQLGSVALEGLFQLGIVVLALGFLFSLLRYRLYDAEAAISRSAVYAALTLMLVGTFAASEALIELIGQNLFGMAIGNISGAVAAAVAAMMLTPLHGRISAWAEGHFQHDLMALKQELPDMLAVLSAGGSVARLAAAVLPRIGDAVHATRMALLLDGKLVAAEGISQASARRQLTKWTAPDTPDRCERDDSSAFPLRLPLRCPLGTVRAWLLLGPRPDGSFYGRDDIDALSEIAPPLQRTLMLVADREAGDRDRRLEDARYRRNLDDLVRRVAALERSMTNLPSR